MSNKDFKILEIAIKELVERYKNTNYQGQCFKIAFETFVFLAERGIYPKLVHANINIENNILGHAWVEYYNVVIDLTLDNNDWIQDIHEYYKLAQIGQIIKYDMNQIQKLILKYGNQFVWCDWIVYKE